MTATVKTWLSRVFFSILVVGPLGIIAILTVNSYLPAFKNPETNVYLSSKGYPAKQRAAGLPIEVQTAKAQENTVTGNLAAPGEAVALDNLEIRPQISATVKQVYVKEGDFVKKGQLLVELDNFDQLNKVQILKTSVEIGQNNLENLQRQTSETLSRLEKNVEIAQTRLESSTRRSKETLLLVEGEIKHNVEAIKLILANAEYQVEVMRELVEEGAISRFQLLDAEKRYADIRKQLLNAQQGEFIHKDRVLNNDKELVDAEIHLALAEQTLAEKTLELQANIKQARMQQEINQLELERAEKQLARTLIYAPTDGLVSELNLDPGEFADAGQQNSVINLSQNVVFKAYVDQARLNEIKVGEKATVSLIAYPGETFSAEVIQVNPTVETDSIGRSKVGVNRQFTYSVWLKLDNLQIPPGLQGYAEFQPEKSALIIPEEAVTYVSAGEGMVMVLEEGEAVVKKVKLGRKFENQREVLAGLELGAEVVLNARALLPGDKLVARNEAES